MQPIKQYFNRPLTVRETIMVLVSVAILVGLGYAAYEFTAARLLEARVDATIPKVCGAIREQRGKLVSAIEAYKNHFGFYPPDHVLSRQPLVVDAITNTLLYELAGVIFDSTNKMFQVGGLEPAQENYVKQFFQVDAFKNCAETSERVSRFLAIQPLPAAQLHDDPDVFAVGFQMPNLGVAPEVFWSFSTSPWRYVSSSPTNNPGKFDLWLELKTKARSITIGNWKAVE